MGRLRQVRTRHEERALPHFDEAERAILGAVLLDNQAFNTATQILTPDDFFGDANRLIYEAMGAISRRSETINTVTLREELTRRDVLERAGGAAYISGLIDGIPAAANVEQYARSIKDKAILRDAIAAAETIRNMAMDPGADPEVVLVGSQQAIAAIANGAGRAAERFRVYELADYLELRLPPRQPLLSPWFYEKDLALLYANRGTGKTWVALSIALGVATGQTVMGWKAAEPAPVLYVDGEMPIETLQTRTSHLLAGLAPDVDTARIPFRILAADAQEIPVPALDSPEGERLIDAILGDAKLVVFDNISTLFGAGPENEAEAWGPAQDLLLGLRRRGVAVLLVHHAGKNGAQRGTSRREDVLDVVVKLQRPGDYRAEDGARFEVRFEKTRGLSGGDAASFEAQLATDENGFMSWLVADVEGQTRQRVIELLNDGLSPGAVASELRLHRATIYRHRRAAIAEGSLDDK